MRLSPEATAFAPRQLLVPVVVAVQILVPTVALFLDPPTRLGFQMYSGLGEIPGIEIKLSNRVVESVPHEEVLAWPRAELDWSRYLPRHLCDSRPGTAEVSLVYRETTRTFTC